MAQNEKLVTNVAIGFSPYVATTLKIWRKELKNYSMSVLLVICSVNIDKVDYFAPKLARQETCVLLMTVPAD